MNPDPVQELLRLALDEGHLPSAHLEEVLERKVLSGGGVETALIELGFLDEDTALALLARCWSMPTANRARLEHPSKDSVAVLPQRIAERHGLCPIELIGRKLVVAARAPDDVTAFDALLEELGFALSLHLRAVITTEPRLSWALRRAYGLPVPPRHEAVLSSWGESPRPVVAPGQTVTSGGPPIGAGYPQPVSEEGPLEFDVDVESHADDNGWRWRTRATLQEATAAPVFEGLGDDDESGWSVRPPGQRLPVSSSSSSSSSSSGVPAPASSAPGLSLIVEGTVAAPDEATARLRDHLQRLEVEERATEARRRTKVLWTVDDALAELALAATRDELLEVTLRFAWRRLKTAAIVVHHGKSLVVWDILDELLRASELRRFAIDADADHALSRALRLRSPVLGPVDVGDPLLRLLGRRPRAVLILPILIGERCVGAVIGDNAERAVPPSALADLHMVVPRLGKALGNLILRARRGGAPPSTPPTPVEVLPPPEPPRPAPLILLEEGEEDVFLDDLALLALEERRPGPDPKASSSTRIALPVPLSPPPVPARADGDDDDDGIGDIEDIGFADEADLRAPPPGAPDQSEGQREQQRAPELSVDVVVNAAATTTPPAAREGAVIDDVTVAPSPGARARESLHVATWRAWLHQAVISADDDLDELVTALATDGDAAKVAAQRLVTAGPRALLALARAFPGVLAHHPFEGAQSPLLLEAQAASPYFATLQRLGADAVAPILVGELDHDDRLHRFGAVVGLSVIDVPAALPRLAQRAFDPEQRLASLAVDVLGRHSGSPAFGSILARLRDLCRRGDDFQRLRAVRAVAALRDGGALPVLVDLLGARPRDVADEARTALVEITCQDFGTAERRWRAWLADHGAKPRRGWLLAALAHKDVALRKSAADELREWGTALFDYRHDAPLREREASVAAITKAQAQAAQAQAAAVTTTTTAGPIDPSSAGSGS